MNRRTNDMMGKRFIARLVCSIILCACSNEPPRQVLFELLTSEKTKLDFANRLNSTDSLNLFKYMYFYNGAGVGAGDFNNDGLVDLFFASNQGQNSLYLNKGQMQFANVTREASIPENKAWSTGVSVVDINNDGLLDIYVSTVGNYRDLKSTNQFLICEGINNGIPRYVDKAKEYGLDFSGFGTQSAFLDYDMDGDLDVFLLNHSVHENGTFRARSLFMGTFHPTSGSRLYRNDGTTFTDITKESGINSTAIGYGLGISVSDINVDGYPDIYIGNDFHENDYLYINQKNGEFKDVAAEQLMHTSQYTMGVDVADANNDGYPEIMSVDMLPSDPYILKRSLGEDTYDIFFLKIGYGYNYQYTRNNLQLNKRNNHFSEIGLYSGVAATDWSWSPLWMDFNNDGLKDLFISNGIPKRMNDIDYINYVSDQQIQDKIRDNKLDEKDEALIKKFPQIKIPNKFYLNKGEMKFEDLNQNIANDIGTYSNGAVYADFDNDGDLDVVVNNIDEPAIVYRNTSNDKLSQTYLQLKLKGPKQNVNALGSRLVIFSDGQTLTYEKYPVRGFLSSMETPLHVGLDSTTIDSMFVVWPDNTYQPVEYVPGKPKMEVEWVAGLPAYNFEQITGRDVNRADSFVNIASAAKLDYLHEENSFREFDREPLMPHMVSTEGPALAVADINADGLDDVFIGSSKGKKSAVYLQQLNGTFATISQPSLDIDSSFEDVDAIWQDVNNDSFPDLIIASGGNEYFGHDRHLVPRVYMNDAKGVLSKKPDAFTNIYQTASCVAANDFNGDGFPDLFISGRAVPWQYGKIPPSYLLQNDGTGRFSDVTARYAPELQYPGFVTKAIWFDINSDNKKDLLVCGEWGTIDAYLYTGNKFEKKILFDRKGWWNTLIPCDVNGDGKPDLVAGNLGLNSRLKASEKQPVRLYYADFDDNGKKEQVMTYYLNNKEVPFANKAEMERQIPELRKKFLYAEDFAKAKLANILDDSKLEDATLFTSSYFSHCVLLNKGNLQFEAVELPWQSQLTPIRDMMVTDANNDGFPDIMLMGNYYQNNIEMGRYDAGYGSILLNNGKGIFTYADLPGLTVKGEARKIEKINIGGREACVIARNNDSVMVISKRERRAS